MEKNCNMCGRLFSKQPSDSLKYWAVKRHCSLECANKSRRGVGWPEERKEKLRKRNGAKSHAWKGGVCKGSGGYLLQYVGRKHVLQHRYVMEQHLGRKLDKTEHVHHKNGDKTDNRIENLELIDRKTHGLIHARQRWHGEPV